MRIERMERMRDYASKLTGQLVIIYEMDGHAGVEQYAR